MGLRRDTGHDDDQQPEAAASGATENPASGTAGTSTGTDTDTGEGSPARDEPVVVNRYLGTGVSFVLLGLFVVFVIGIVVLAQNTDGVPFEFLWFEAEPPLFVLLLATGAAAAGATLVVAEIWRRRRRRQRAEHEELQQLRREREQQQG